MAVGAEAGAYLLPPLPLLLPEVYGCVPQSCVESPLCARHCPRDRAADRRRLCKQEGGPKYGVYAKLLVGDGVSKELNVQGKRFGPSRWPRGRGMPRPMKKGRARASWEVGMRVLLVGHAHPHRSEARLWAFLVTRSPRRVFEQRRIEMTGPFSRMGEPHP